MAQDLNGSNANPAKNIVKVNVLRANVKQTKVIDTDIVFVLEDGRTVFIRDGAVQSLLDSGFSVEFSDGDQVTGQELLQSAGAAEISSVALTGPQASSNDGVIVAQAPQAVGTSPVAAPSSGGGLKTWLAVGTPLVGGVLGGVLGGGGGAAAAPTTGTGTGTGTTTNVKPATPVINVVANDDKVSAAEKGATAGVAVTGIAEASASVTVNWGSTSKTVTADSAGRWSASFTSAEVPADAPGTTISAIVKSTAGVSSDPATRTVQIDTTPPAAPVIANVAGDNVIGPTEKTSGVNINGTAEAGSMVTVGFGGINKTVAADMGGNWSVNYAATEVPVAGSYPVTATAQDANGNVGTTPASRSIIVAAAVNVTGQIVAGPVVTGNGLSVDIYLANGTLLVSGVKVNADGSFTANNLPVGTGDVIFARVLDSTTSADYLDEATGVATDLNAVLLATKVVEGTSVTMNINPLTTIAAIRAGLAADGSGTIANAAAATNANTATAQAFGLSGIDITTSSVVATNSGGYNPDDGMSSGEKIGAVLAALSGMDSLNAGNSQTTITSLSQSIGSNGELTSQGQVSLMRGAIAAEDKVDGSLQNLVSDSLAASSPETQVTINAIATDNIITGNEVANLTLSGTVSSGATGVSVLLGTKTSAASVSGTTWSYTLSAADIAALGDDGAKVIQAQAALPNAASATASRVVTLKIAPPAAPTLNVVSGDNAINGLEKTAGVAFSGTGEAGSIVVLTFGSVTKNVLVGSAGTWTTAFLASEIPADGSSTVSVVAKDSFGNSSAAVTRSIQIDTVAPSLAPIINPVTGDDLIGPSEKRVGIDIQGTADALAIISLTFGNFVRTATANALGVWSVRILSSQIPEDGETLVTATQSDAAGNVSAAATRTVNIDAQPPSKPVILPVATDNIVNATEKLSGIVLRGTAEPNTLIELNLGLINRTTRTLANGTWSVSLSPAQIPLDGTVNVSVTATDSSGNVSEAGTRTFTIDTVIQQPIIASIATDNVVNAAEKLTNLTVTGQGEPGANVVVTLGGTSRNVAINQSGAWLVSFLPAEIPGDTLQTAVTVQSTDQAGNISDMATQNIRIDTVAHATPVISTVAGDDLINATERAGTITVNGTAEAGAAVSVTWNGFVKNVIANTLGAWNATYTSAEQPSDGTSTITARATDTAGNVNAVDGTRSVTTLTTPPALPVINLVAGDDRINITERSNGITVTGTATNGARVEVTFGTTTKTVTANGTGVWNANFATNEVATEGAVRPITAVQTDVNGNISGTATRNVAVDLTLPTTPTGLDLFTTDDTGASSTDNLTNKQSVKISGMAETGSTVELFNGTTSLGTATADATTGAFSLDVTLTEGTRAITAKATDLAGNVSLASAALTIRVDTTVAAPTGLDLAAVDDTGTNNDNITSQTSGLTISGTAEAGSTVELFNGTTSLGTATADATTGAFSLDVTLTEGTRSITAKATDLAGNVSLASAALTIRVDTTPPAAPTGLDLAAVDDTGSSNSDNITSQTSGLTISGTAEAGSTVELFNGTTSLGTTTADATTGAFSLDVTLTEGTRSITAKATDAAGNVSLASAALAITVDTTAPAGPAITSPIAGNNIINAAEKNAGVTISGTAPNSTTVEVRIGGGTAKSVTSNGAWSITFAGTEIPADATGVAIEARTIDAAGNTSAWVGASATVTIDTTPPAAAPFNLDLAGADDTGSSNSDNLTSQTTGLTISGKAGNNATVELFDGATSLGTTTANGSGDFTLDVTLAAGTRSITAREIDSAGNASVASAALTIIVDTTVAAPTSLDLDEADDLGLSNSDNITNRVSNLTITGQAEANASVQLFNNGVPLGTAITADATGAFSLDVTLGARVLPHSITAIATDTAGNVSLASAALTIIIDTTAPAAPKGVDPVAIPTLSNIVNGIGGFVINGVAAEDQSGWSVRSAGDVNNDGLDDLIIGARFADPTATTINAGASYVVFGKAGGASVNLSDVASGTRDLGFVINGAAAGDLSGYSVSSAGDVDGDGLDDLIIGAPSMATNGTNSGGTFVVFGKTDDDPVNLSAIASGNGALGFVILGLVTQDNLGGSVSSAGDVNKDGIDDLIVGVPGADLNGVNSGASYVVFGNRNRNTTAVNLTDIASGNGGFVINGAAAQDFSGRSVSFAGDVNGDGFGDLIVGADFADANGNLDSGASYVVFGKAGGARVDLSHVASGVGGFVINGVAAGDQSGRSVSFAGDVNNDGLDDLIVGVRNADPNGTTNAGASYVVFGKTDGTQVNLSNIVNGIGGFVINGAAAGDESGFSVSSAGDLNNDGFDDLIVGAWGADPNGALYAGASYVVYGKANTTPVNLSAIGTGGFVISGAATNDQLGRSVSSAGDVNGDGVDDLIVGARYADRNGNDSGASYVIFGGNFTGTGATLDLATADDTGSSNSDNITSQTSGLTFTGQAEANALIRLFNNGNTLLGTTTASATGAFSVDVTLAGGVHAITARATDIAGNLGAASAVLTVTVDTTAPAAPTALDLAAVDDTGSSNSDNITSQTSALTITGTAEANARVELFNGTTFLGATTANATTGAFSVDVRLAFGQRSITARATDSAGNVGDASAPLGITVTQVNVSDIVLGTGGFVINGVAAGNASGYSVSSAGDVNNDGYDDMIVGAIYAVSGFGASYVVFGRADNTTPINLSAIASGTSTLGFAINGGSVGAAFIDNVGNSVRSAGDVNNDGFDDLIVGANTSNISGSGASFVVFGKADGAAVNLSAIVSGTYTRGFVINGVSGQSNLGHSVSSAGDVNGDGRDDVIVGTNGTGTSYVVFGKTNNTAVNPSTLSTGGFAITGAACSSVSSAGDVNGDGLDDVILGSPGANGQAGASYVVFGKNNNTTAVNLSTLGTQGFVINGKEGGDQSGISVSSAGDVNGDGLDDLIVGAALADRNGVPNIGVSYVVFGKTDDTAVNLSDVENGIGGFAIMGRAISNFQSGGSVSSAGDVNGDGLDDLIVATVSGPNYVVFGKTDGTKVELEVVLTGNGTQGFVINASGSGVADRVSSAGDVNGDGFDDIIMGLPYGTNGNASYVVFGGNFTGAVSHVGTANNDVISGTVGNDVIFGGFGNDVITGNGGNDRIVGGAGNDMITGNGGNDVIFGGFGNDVITGNGGNDRLDGGTGNDTLIISNANFGRVDGGADTDTLRLAGTSGFTLNLSTLAAGAIKDIEVIDLVAGSLNNILTVTQQTLMNLSTTTNRLTVLGDSGDTVNAFGFTQIDAQTENGITYLIYGNGSAELWVQSGVQVNRTVSLSSEDFVALASSWTDQTDLAGLVSPPESNFAPAISWTDQTDLAGLVSPPESNFAPAISWTDQTDLAGLVSPPESNFAPAISWTDQAVLAV